MSTHRLPTITILAAGVGMGSAGNFLLRTPGEPALNFALLFAGLAASMGLVALGGGARLSREALGWIVAGLLFGAALFWRGSELLRFLAFLSASTAFALPALRAGGPWIWKSGVGDLLEAVFGAGAHAALGSLRLLQRTPSESAEQEEALRTARTVARSTSVGILLAVVPLSIFGALFLSADPVFAGILGDFVRIDLASLGSHLVLTAILTWLACGYLAGFASGTRLESLRALGWRPPRLRTAEVAIALGLVDLLFLAFVIVQFRYLFGGGEMVEITPGLTYSAYARQGFFQLVAATALGLPWLLTADSLLKGDDRTFRQSFRTLAAVQLVLLLAIVGSAMQRMRAYLDAYGLTEDRFVATAVLFWLAGLVVWFGITVLREQRDLFASGALVSGFGLIALLHLSNPTAHAALSHLDRGTTAAGQDPAPGSPLDVDYLTSLGSDAVPVLVDRVHGLHEATRRKVAIHLLSRWGSDREWDWRSWNLADWRAREIVRSKAEVLRAMAETARSGFAPPTRP